MNLLIITLCVLIKTTLISAALQRLAVRPSLSTFNRHQLVQPLTTPSTPITHHYDSTTLQHPRLINTTLISAAVKRLVVRPPLSTFNRQQLLAQTSTTPPVTHHYDSTTLQYPRPSDKSLYSYKYNTDTGIQVQEEGHLKNVGTDQEILEAQGRYSYTDNTSNTFEVSYIANEEGFQPEGAHLPTVPPLIKKALRYIAEHPEENAE